MIYPPKSIKNIDFSSPAAPKPLIWVLGRPI